ncbi:MAG: ATP-dependent helicase [Bryobacteraceae bacterium]
MTTVNRSWSNQQQRIFSWFENGTGHLIVRARAGTGKTTTIIEGIGHASEERILLCAFNKRIAEELTARLSNPRAQAKTLHAVGYAVVRRYWEGLKIASGQDRANALTDKVCGPTCPDDIKRLVSKLHSKGREIAPHARKMGDLTDIAETFECVPESGWATEGYDQAYVERKALEAMELAAKVKPVDTGIDFADMIFLPVRNRWLHKSYDLVVVDEAQDMTVAQLEIALGVCKGRLCVVGDDRQAIYGFRGADSDSLDRLKTALNASELGLTTTYRCGRLIVDKAAQLVPDFEAGPNNPEGAISTLATDKLLEAVALGDFILSRLNAPLVSLAMALLKSGRRTRIAGRDVGAGLKGLIRKFKARSVPNLLARIHGWEDREITRLTKAGRPERVDAVHDQADMLITLTEGARNVRDVEAKIDALFTDDGLGQAGVITCSSVHRAKGLEANRVFILASTLRAHNQEELNIQYVAITRAKSELVMVYDPK